MSNLEGRVAVVVGAATGIGARTAEVFASAGASVVVSDINEDAGQEHAAKIRADGGEATFVRADVGVPADMEALMASAASAYGTIDVLHNNAAAMNMFSQDLPIDTIEIEDWDRIMQINMRGVMLGCKYALPYMLRQQRGSIVNTTSCRAFAGALNWPAYGTSKLGVVGITKYVASCYGKQGIRCNAISPGLILTPAAAVTAGEELLTSLLRHHLTPRVGTPDDIAQCALFLASDLAGYITGQVIPVDGGISAHQPYYADQLDGITAAADA